MVVIGKTRNGYILEASNDEIANLVGYYSQYQAHTSRLEIGEEIRVHAMYTALREMSGMEKRMQEARAILATVAGGLTMVDPIVRQVAEAVGKVE